MAAPKFMDQETPRKQPAPLVGGSLLFLVPGILGGVAALPILAAGSFAGTTGRYLERAGRGRSLALLRRGAGALVGLAGLYFLLSPLAAGS